MIGRSRRAGAVVASVPLALWLLYVGVGWNVAPRLCASPGWLNGVSATVLLSSALAVVAAARLLDKADEAPQETTALGHQLAAGLGALFTCGVALAWVLAALWCN